MLDRLDDTPLRICLLTYRGNPRSGGQGVYVKLLSRELVRMGHDVDVWSGPPYPELDPEVGLVRVPSLDLWNEKAPLRMPPPSSLRDAHNRSEFGRTFLLGEFPEMRTFSARVASRFKDPEVASRYDIVHDNQSLGPGLLEVAKSVPVVATIHHPVTRDFRIALENAPSIIKRYGLRRWYSFLPMQQKVARELERIFTVSQASLDDLVVDYGIARDRIEVVGNGIDVDAFCPAGDSERLNNRLVTTLSADTPLKGFGYLLEALAELRETRRGLKLIVIGSLKDKSPNRDKLAELDLAGAVRFTGRVPTERIAQEYARATAAVVPSLYEGFGFPAGEAMACGVPIVSTTGGALPEVVGESGVAGELVEPASTADLIRGLTAVLDASPERRREMGEAGRERVMNNFTWRHAAERTVRGYRSVLRPEAVAC